MKYSVLVFIIFFFSINVFAGDYEFCLKISDSSSEVFCSVRQIIYRTSTSDEVNSMSNWSCTKDFTELKIQNFMNSPAGSDYVSFGGPFVFVDYATINFLNNGPQKLFASLLAISDVELSASKISIFFLKDKIYIDPSYLITKRNLIYFQFLGYESCFEK